MFHPKIMVPFLLILRPINLMPRILTSNPIPPNLVLALDVISLLGVHRDLISILVLIMVILLLSSPIHFPHQSYAPIVEKLATLLICVLRRLLTRAFS